MRALKVVLSFCILLVLSPPLARPSPGTALSKEQVSNLAAAAWEEPPHSIDVTLYEELTRPAKPLEQIRQEVEDSFKDDIAALGQDPHPVLLQRVRDSIELNFEWRVKRQRFPALMKRRIRIAGHNQRIDQVIAQPGSQLDPNVAFDSTYVNVGQRDSPDFFSFNYEHKVKHATIEHESGWAKRDPAQFAHLPAGISWLLKTTVGVKEGKDITAAFVPDPIKMRQLAEEATLTGGFRLTVKADPNGPDARDRIEIRDPNSASGGIVLICDRDDYSRIYYFEYSVPGSTRPLYVRECSNFDPQGFPHSIAEAQYDHYGNLKEKSVYRVEKVELNPDIEDTVFEFNPPAGYKVIDLRSKSTE